MKKSKIEIIYMIIFMLAMLLYLLAIWRFIIDTNDEWFTFVLALSIMFLSFWGYVIVHKYIK